MVQAVRQKAAGEITGAITDVTTKEQMPAIDAEAEALDLTIGKHMAKRLKLEKKMKLIQQQLDWQTRRIRELSQQRSITLNFKLPGIE